MFDMRRSDEAEGESRIMGSGRRAGFLGSETRDDVLELADNEGARVPLLALDAEEGWGPGRGRLRPRKISADFRIWEKS